MDYGLKEQKNITKTCVAPLTTRNQVKKQLWSDTNIDKSMKKTLLSLWEEDLIFVYPNETIMLTEKGNQIGIELQKNAEFTGGYSDYILSLFKSFMNNIRLKGKNKGDT